MVGVGVEERKPFVRAPEAVAQVRILPGALIEAPNIAGRDRPLLLVGSVVVAQLRPERRPRCRRVAEHDRQSLFVVVEADAVVDPRERRAPNK
jgi:hypothetical protein